MGTNNWNVIDHTPLEKTEMGKFKIEEIDFIEQTGKLHHHMIVLKNGDVHLYRCSCAIIFEGTTLIIS